MAGPREQEPAGAVSYVNIVLPPAWPEAAAPDLVDRIVCALYAHPQTRAALEAAGGGMAPHTPRYMTLAGLQGGPPPPGVPLFNEAIGVLEVPAPPHGGIQAVEAAIAGLADGIQVVPSVTHHTPRPQD